MGSVLHIVFIIAIIAIVLCAVAFCVIKFLKLNPEERKKRIYDIVYALAVKAEQLYGSKTGEAKKKQVVAWFYEKYTWLSLIIASDELSAIIDEIVYDMTEYFKNNPVAALNILGRELTSNNSE